MYKAVGSMKSLSASEDMTSLRCDFHTCFPRLLFAECLRQVWRLGRLDSPAQGILLLNPFFIGTGVQAPRGLATPPKRLKTVAAVPKRAENERHAIAIAEARAVANQKVRQCDSVTSCVGSLCVEVGTMCCTVIKHGRRRRSQSCCCDA
jgi:hypothetical protein